MRSLFCWERSHGRCGDLCLQAQLSPTPTLKREGSLGAEIRVTPVTARVTAPVTARVTAPVTTRVTAPVTTRVTAPVTSPSQSPQRRHLNIRMGRRKAPGKKRKVQCSPECVLPVLNVSASGSQINAERDHELLSGNQPSMILLSMLEELEAKLDNLQNTLEDVPSRVAGLMEQIWIEKGQHHLENGGVSLGMVSPVTVRDSSFSRSPPINLSVRSRELNQCLQPTSPRLLEPQKSQSLQPMSLDGHGLQQDCTISRGPSLDVSVIQGETNLRLPQTFDDEEEPLQAHCTQLEPEEHVKKEQLYADTWDPQQMDPPFHEGYEPQQNHSRQTVLPDEKETDVHIKQEELWFDGEAPQQNHCRQPAFQEEQCLQHNACLQQVLSDAQEQHQNCKTEPMQSEVQNADQLYKLEPLHPENCDQNYKQEPLHPEDRDENYEQEPLHPGDRDENYEQEPLHPEDRDETYEQEPLHPEDRDETSEQEPLHPAERDENSNLQRTCTDVQGPSVSSSFLAQNITDTDGAIATGALERRKSDVLLFKAIPGQQPQKESMDDQEKHKASRGVKYFAHKLNEKKHQTTHWGERVNNETLLLKQKRIDSGLGAYPWAECKKTFTGKTHLLLHEKTHTELRQCPYPEQETRSADEATLTHQEKTFVQKTMKEYTQERGLIAAPCVPRALLLRELFCTMKPDTQERSLKSLQSRFLYSTKEYTHEKAMTLHGIFLFSNIK
ncbi:hypothetical protein NDU88_007965 [Pleurodeles waltl]|uniref:C2H2-type domain-containing protein n=1 Tax=Pleurodeles waltl TaxID=8319 RepID=A0AAV7SU97_PLEWA|nr:hypothetical protein NDU88_007965 [Pleurodeles waltl]